VFLRAEEAVVIAAVAASTAASVAVVFTEAAVLVEAVSTPPDLMAVISAALRLAGAASGMDFGPA